MGIRTRLERKYEEIDNEKRLKKLVATKEDMKKLERDMNRSFKKQKQLIQPQQGKTMKVVKMIGKGLRDINESLASPSDERRPKISQLPRRRTDMEIALPSIDLERLKHPNLRGMDIRGKKVKKGGLL